jgi:DNA-binding response OmpR family regulator
MAETSPYDVPGSEHPASSNGKKILIAEDDPFISRMYLTKLTNAGFKVTVKNNGRDAYESIKADKPDLMMLDISMPELSGFEVLAALKKDDFDFSATPVMILTNSSNPEHRSQADSYGVDYMIKAEMTPQQVLQHINEKLGLK